MAVEGRGGLFIAPFLLSCSMVEIKTLMVRLGGLSSCPLPPAAGVRTGLSPGSGEEVDDGNN